MLKIEKFCKKLTVSSNYTSVISVNKDINGFIEFAKEALS